ncbi:leucine-rich repeat-containing protein 4 [Lates japonicus]|uniref:Leucine-rich repeat-containing protein 4 n=1 Tax=Lates japonicus TaxID=270547 RepID=A0AAD3NIW5_LATJO|nr:leucine-rich repeat-containing protein 4 [Lates japonicus]
MSLLGRVAVHRARKAALLCVVFLMARAWSSASLALAGGVSRTGAVHRSVPAVIPAGEGGGPPGQEALLTLAPSGDYRAGRHRSVHGYPRGLGGVSSTTSVTQRGTV